MDFEFLVFTRYAFLLKMLHLRNIGYGWGIAMNLVFVRVQRQLCYGFIFQKKAQSVTFALVEQETLNGFATTNQSSVRAGLNVTLNVTFETSHVTCKTRAVTGNVT